MFNTLFGDIRNGRLKRLPFLLHSILLWLLMLGTVLAIAVALGAAEHIIGGDLQRAQEQLMSSFGGVAILIFIVLVLLFVFASANLHAKRIRDIGIPGWWGVLAIFLFSTAISILLSPQIANGLGTLIWFVILLIPSDTVEITT
ncbi:DUF805 domain-containing protein [Solemya elarraichensis gill symbiont]|uniref:DUF805 domain-containing protein n=1 Tax=Solemya elarraichensis gill symbiont TaxID=1918949 RepID=A0A1T2LCS1_9GAMM|nr:DUF805 domain-containing protein [Solemya elarraichensis gill symbiont]OOZ42898.1 hypothetical protein BOW52_01100 [Solemya elarraichensis gill symbiont]